MATQSEEEKKRTGQVEQGNAKPGETAKDTTVRQQTPEPPRVPVLAYDLYSDSPANANRGTTVQPAQPRPNTGANYVRPQSPQDRLNESYQNSHNRWEAEKARRAQFRADHGGRNEWQEREHQDYLRRIDERKQRIQQFNDNVRGGNFEGMTRISDDNWSKMGEGSATAQTGWKMNADGKTIAVDENGKPVRETSYTVEGKIDHNSEENVRNKAALEEWSKNQWRTNFNNGVVFNRYDGGFDTSKLPKGVFDKDGNLDLSKITSQKQMNALMQIMRQDQEATGAKGRKSNAEQAAAQVDRDLKASGLSDDQIAGMSKEQRTAARDQFKLNSAARALESFYRTDAQSRQNPGAAEADLQVEAARRHLGLPTPQGEEGRIPNVAQSRLDATLALREAGFSNAQIRKMIEGNDSSALRGRLEARQARQRQAGVTLRGDNPAAQEIEAEARNQFEEGATEGLPTVEQATPKPGEPLDTGDLEAHRQAMEGVDLNANPFAEEDAAEFAAQQAATARVQAATARVQAGANLADPESVLSQTIRGMGAGEQPARPGIDNGFDLAAAIAADRAAQAARAPGGQPALSARVPAAPSPSSPSGRPTPVRRGGLDPVAAALMFRGGFNRAGLEATTATFAAPVYAAAQVAGGATRAAMGDATGGAIQAAGGLAASGALGRTTAAITERRGNPLMVRGGPSVSIPAQQIEANVRSRTVRAQGRAGAREGMVTPQQLQNRPRTPGTAEVERGWQARAAARQSAKENRAIARYQQKAAAARAEEAKISAAAERDAARTNAREARSDARRANRRERLIREDVREQMRAITSGRRANTSGRRARPRRVEHINSIRARARERQRVNLREAR